MVFLNVCLDLDKLYIYLFVRQVLVLACSPTLLSYSSYVSLSLGRWTTHWISCSTRAVTIWMYIGSPSWSELFSLRTQEVMIQDKLLYKVLFREKNYLVGRGRTS